MQFHQFNTKLQEHFQAMSLGTSKLFQVAIDPDYLWEVYLDSFPAEMNQLFRKRREFDCSCCRQFVKNFGATVRIEGNFTITTIWDFQIDHPGYQQVLNKMSEAVREYAINSAYINTVSTQGTACSLDMSGETVITWNHFHLEMPAHLRYFGRETLDSVKSNIRTTKEVLQRSIEELSTHAVAELLDMIDESIVYRGEEWKRTLQQFAGLQTKYFELPKELRNNFLWLYAATLPEALTRIRNHSIGTLLQDLTNGVETEEALRKWNVVMAPTNYKQPKGVFSKKMVENAQKTIEELGYQDSLGRRFANLADIKVSDVLFADRNAKKHMNGLGGIMEALKEQVTESPDKFKNATPISIEDFIKDILPTASSIEALVENRHQSNLVSLIAPTNPDAMSMFKWGNNFSWAYSGNLADSQMKELVKQAGGKVDGVLRFSLQWENDNDLDAHCHHPGGHIYFGDKRNYTSKGELDVDIINPVRGKSSVENITFPQLKLMRNGSYQFSVHCYNHRTGRDGFTAEIEFNGQRFSFTYPFSMIQGQTVNVATVNLKEGTFTLVPNLQPTSNTIATETWNISTNTFQKVALVCLSPNYWGTNTGNKHYMFMLAGCKNPEVPNGFFNEYLHNDLMAHRQVFAALGKMMKVEQTDDQLSGLGFSSTVSNSLIVRVNNRIYKIVF